MDLSNPAEVSTSQIRDAFVRTEFTPVDLLEATVTHASRVEPQINAIAFLNTQQARRQAEASALRWRSGKPLSALDGIPVSIKDSVNASGTPWRHGTKPNASLSFATVDSPPAARLKEAGAVLLAKTTMSDFGMLAAGVSSLYGIVRNPWNLSMTTGGSSAGAGASLAAGICWASVGSDIAGSVRLPAAHCGLVAVKPTQGRIPHLAPSTVRSAGPMARTVREAAELLEIISRPDARDLFALPGGPITVASCLPDTLDISGLRVGLLLDFGYGFRPHEHTVRVISEATEALAGAGAQVTSIPPVFDHDAYAPLDRLFQVRARAEWEALGDLNGSVLGEVADWCAAGSEISATQHERDQITVLNSAAHVRDVTNEFDIVISAVLPGTGFTAQMVGLDRSVPLAHCSYTCWYNHTGQPAATLPFGRSEGMPVGVQVVGRRFDDARVMQVASWLEAQRPIDLDWPVEPRDLPPVDQSFFAHDYGGY